MQEFEIYGLKFKFVFGKKGGDKFQFDFYQFEVVDVVEGVFVGIEECQFVEDQGGGCNEVGFFMCNECQVEDFFGCQWNEQVDQELVGELVLNG